MKHAGVLLFLILIVTSTARSQWKKDGKPEADTADRKQVQGFGAQIVVVEDPRAFIQEWLKPETPKIKPATKVKSGEPLGIIVLFVGCKTDSQGVCNSVVDYTISKPDGSVYVVRKDQPLWKEEAPPAQNIQLGRAILAFQMKNSDQSGDYKVTAKISDVTADITFELETKFHLK